MSKTSISISSIKKSRVSLSLTLGYMNNTSGVGNITSSTSISTSYSRDSGRSKTSNAGASRGTVRSIPSSSIGISSISISIRISYVSKTSISVSTIEEGWVSLSLTLSNVNNTGRVGNITTSTSISTS